MLGLFKKNTPKAREVYLALDIGTQQVKAVLFSMQSENQATVEGYGTCDQNLGDMHAGAITDLDNVTQHCIDAIDKAASFMQNPTRPTKLILGIAGELVKGYTTTVSVDRKSSETKITIAELKTIISNIQWKAFDRIRKQLAFETGFNEIDVKLISSAVVESRIDGYRIANPLGFQGKSISMSVFNCFAPLVHLGSMQSIAASLNMPLLTIAAEPYAVSKCITYEDGGDFSAIFIDVGGGTTDIALVHNGGVVGTKMFGLGGRVFSKRIATALGVAFEDAEALKIAYAKGELNYESTKQVKEVLQEDASTWISGVELAIEEFEKIDILPSRIYLCGGGSQLPEMMEQLNGDWYKEMNFAKKPTTSFIKPSQIKRFTDPHGLLTQSSHVTPLALANLSLELQKEDPLTSKLLKKALKVVRT